MQTRQVDLQRQRVDPRFPEKVQNLVDEVREEVMVGLELTLNGEENRYSASNLEHIMEDQLKEMLLRV